MDAQVRRGTPTSDTVIEIKGVSKTFRQRQRSEKLSEVMRNLLHPTIKEVLALQNVSLTIGRGEIVEIGRAHV